MIAVYIDNKIEKYYEEIYYTLDFIFQTLGYEYKCITKLDQLNDNDILFYYGLIEPNEREAHILAFNKILFYVPVEITLYSVQNFEIEKLKNLLKNISLVGNIVPVFSKQILKTPVLFSSNEKLYYGKFLFDIIGNIFFSLVNHYTHISCSDENSGKISDSDTFLLEYSLFPYINAFLWLMDNFLQNSIKEKQTHILVKKDFWPAAENFAVCISHTVDHLQKWNYSSIITSTINELMMFYKVRYNFKSFFSKLKYLMTNIEEYWNFEEIYEIEDKYKVNSTFFWGVESNSKDDADYLIDEPDVEEEINRIKEKGNEIALLASSKSYRSDTHANQKKSLLNAINEKNIGVRQNKFKFDFDITPELHNKNNYLYDSSMSFLDHTGFKNGIGFPYRIFPRGKKDKTGKTGKQFKKNCLEIPLTFSDNSLKLSKVKILSMEKAAELIDKLMKSVNNVNGLFSLDLSVPNFADINYTRTLFDQMLKNLHQKKIFWGTYKEIAAWWEKRESVLIKELSRDMFSVYFPAEIKKISISFYGNFKFHEIKGAENNILGNRIIFKDVKADTNVIIKLVQIESEDNS